MSRLYPDPIELCEPIRVDEHVTDEGKTVKVYCFGSVSVADDDGLIVDDNGLEVGDADEAIEYARELLSAAMIAKNFGN